MFWVFGKLLNTFSKSLSLLKCGRTTRVLCEDLRASAVADEIKIGFKLSLWYEERAARRRKGLSCQDEQKKKYDQIKFVRWWWRGWWWMMALPMRVASLRFRRRTNKKSPKKTKSLNKTNLGQDRRQWGRGVLNCILMNLLINLFYRWGDENAKRINLSKLVFLFLHQHHRKMAS